VNMLFLLNGYLIASLLLCKQDQIGRLSVRQFYFLHTLRIFPSMYATVFICGLIAHWHVLKTHCT
jgi:peptidoglycan/LPS O-acetylase OafA/YrhL